MRASLGFDVRQQRVYRIIGRVGSNLKKTHWVHEGTRPHVIRPRYKKALKFTSGGTTFIRSSVNHPGIGSTPFLTTAMRIVCVPMGFVIDRKLPARLRPTDATLAP